MRGGLGWRLCLFAFLLSVGRADIPSDPEGSRSGDLSKVYHDDINESISEEDLTDTATEKDATNSDQGMLMNQNSENNHPGLYNTIEEGRTRPEWLAGSLVHPPGHVNSLAVNSEPGNAFPSDSGDFSGLRYEHVDQNISGGQHLHEDLVYSKDPSYERELEDENSLRSANEGFTSRVIPEEKHVLLHNIPGGNNAIVCSKEGELHNYWSPNLHCMVCVCLRANGWLRPVCVSCSTCTVPPRPIPPTPSPPAPLTPDTEVSCKPLPTNVPFQSPLDPCKICVCTETLNQLGKIDSEISCQHNPECVIPPPYITTSRPSITPIPLPVCNKFPQNVPFPHPEDPCKLCMCSITLTQYGTPQQQINCKTDPVCLPTPKSTPSPWPVSTPSPKPDIRTCAPLPSGRPFQNPLNPCQICLCTERGTSGDVEIECQENPRCVLPPDASTLSPSIITPVPLPACENFPENVLFPHPHDACQLCKCTLQLKQPYARPEQVISCFTKPECSSTPGPTPNPEPPQPLEVCGSFPVGTPFDDPTNPCRVCVCTFEPSAAETHIQFPPTPPAWNIQCHNKRTPECSLTPLPPQPLTERPQPKPHEVCGNYPLDTPWNDPTDPCRICVCRYGPSPGTRLTTPPSLLSHPAPYLSTLQVMCQLKTECYPPPPEPLTTSPAPNLGTTPTPDITSCKPLPTGTPFQNPLNPCQVCICTESADQFGRPDVIIKCQENPQCVLPLDVTTVPPSPVMPVPLPACAQFPSNVEFPHPQDQCQLCKCTVQVTSWGAKEQHISCHVRAECASTPAPPNPAPWPPAPPGPLPGPSPHESCTPYTPNKPFQHPWDDCQVCVCREAISTERITIEVNCYTKQSCCVELPFDTPGLPGSSSSSDVNLNGPTGGNLIRLSSGDVIGPSDGNFMGSSSGNTIGFSEGNLVGHSGGDVSGPGKMIAPFSGKMIRPLNGNFKAWSINTIEPSSQNYIRPSSGQFNRPQYINEIPRVNLNGPSGQSWIGYSDGKLIGSADRNVLDITDNNNAIGLSSHSLSRPTIGNVDVNLYRHSGQNVIRNSGENWYESSDRNIGENIIRAQADFSHGSTGVNVIRPLSGILNRPLAGNIIGPNMRPSGRLFGLSLPPYDTPGGKVYFPNSGNLIMNRKPIGNANGNGLFRENLNQIQSGHGTGQHELHVLPIKMEPLYLKSEGVETREGEESDPFLIENLGLGISNAEVETSVQSQVLSGDKGSTKMRTKSARPSDDSLDYD